MIEFAELCAKTNFSFLEGASSPEEMVVRAKEVGLHAIAIADRNGFYGSVRAHVAAGKIDQKCLVGAEVEIVDRPVLSELAANDRGLQGRAVDRGAAPAERVIGQAVLLVENECGYHNLCRILTLAHEGLPRDVAIVDIDSLGQRSAGLFLILDLPPWLLEGKEPVCWTGLQRLVSAFQNRAFVASVRRLALDDQPREILNQYAAAQLNVPLIATARPLFHHQSRKRVADVLTCIRKKTTLDRAGEWLLPNGELYLRTPEQMARLFRDAPERLARTVDVARSCSFSLSQIHYSFPCDALERGESPDSVLAQLSSVGAARRYPRGVPEEVRLQIERELLLIARLKVAPFFLSVHDIVAIAREKGILCQGRGSAANSAVCFVLGITAVDPARSNVLFERFLSAERGEPPDIDVDFEHERREEVIQAIYAKYGRDRAAMVSEVISYRGRSALRETCKVFGLSPEQTSRLARMVGPYDGIAVNEHRICEAGFDPQDRRIQLVIETASQIQGFPRHMSTHVGGFVLSARPICEVSPVEPAKIPGRTVVPWDKDDIEALGFFKVDVLGLGMLTAIRKALALVDRSSSLPENEPVHRSPVDLPTSLPSFDPITALAEIPAEDSRVYEAIGRADTVGVFQIESRAQMAMLPRMRPKVFYDLVIEVAIVRPGPIHGGMVHPYLRRRNGEETPDVPHPSLSPILARTLGIPLFQEQVMQIAMACAGYSPGEADELRRDMAAWRRNGRLLRHRDKLLSGFAERNISSDFGERLFQQIQGFGEYGFPESHAASFALLVYASAWLKVHHPAEFACALLNSQPMGFYAPSTIVRDAQKHGVVVFAPDVTVSSWDSTLEEPAASSAIREVGAGGASRPGAGRSERAPSLRLGLRLVRGIGLDVATRIERARTQAPFRDLKDLGLRAQMRRDQIEMLAEAGAVEALVSERRQAIWQARAPEEGEMFASVADREPAVVLDPLPNVDKLRFDYARLGLSISDHPMKHLRQMLERRRVIGSVELGSISNGSRVRVAGLVLSRQRPATASGIVFVTLEDEYGMINLILRPRIFERFRREALDASLLLAHGSVERTPRAPLFERISPNGESGGGGTGTPSTITPVIHVLVSRLEVLVLPRGSTSAALAARSRDFH